MVGQRAWSPLWLIVSLLRGTNSNHRGDQDAWGTARAQASAHKALTLPPGTAGETIVEAAERRKPRVLVGSDAKLVSLIERLMPVSYWRMLNQLRRRP